MRLCSRLLAIMYIQSVFPSSSISIAHQPVIPKSTSRHDSHISSQACLLQTLKERSTKSRRGERTTSHANSRSFVSQDSDCSFGKEDTGQLVQATIPSHATSDALGIVGICRVDGSQSAILDSVTTGRSSNVLVDVNCLVRDVEHTLSMVPRQVGTRYA